MADGGGVNWEMAYCTFHTLFHQLSSSCQKEEDSNANVDDDDADISLLLPACQQYSIQS